MPQSPPISRRALLAAPALALFPRTRPAAARALPFPLRVHAPGWRVSLHARLPRGIRLMVEDGFGNLLVSGYGRGNIHLLEPNGRVRTLAEGMRRPHGLLRDGRWLYVAEEHRVSRFIYDPAGLTGGEVIVAGIPTGGHVSRTIGKGPDGAFYLSVGSSCNVCIEDHPFRAAIMRFTPGGKVEVFARGLRNSVGFDVRPGENVIYAVNAGRDMMGDDVPREELNRVVEGGHYGWPYVHARGVKDPEFWDRRPRGVRFIPPVFTFTAHSTPLSIRFPRRQPDITPGAVALVARHGSWNRSRKSGYDVLWLDFGADGRITARPFLTGFLKGQQTLGRPVDVLERRDGTVLVSDDYTGFIYRLTRA
ncbi:MAG TPA: sorbosone dehydrogenase family protein [Thermopetrobacter sp.]|nr:sorbosone dehydrogenase family protein [Thermopetrobacter sp.]